MIKGAEGSKVGKLCTMGGKWGQSNGIEALRDASITRSGKVDAGKDESKANTTTNEESARVSPKHRDHIFWGLSERKSVQAR